MYISTKPYLFSWNGGNRFRWGSWATFVLLMVHTTPSDGAACDIYKRMLQSLEAYPGQNIRCTNLALETIGIIR